MPSCNACILLRQVHRHYKFCTGRIVTKVKSESLGCLIVWGMMTQTAKLHISSYDEYEPIICTPTVNLHPLKKSLYIRGILARSCEGFTFSN